MTTIFNYIEELEKKIQKANSLRTELVEEKRLRDLDEANAWMTTDFKSLGATTDKLRKAAVQQKMNTMPNVYASKKAEFENLILEIDLLKKTVDVMSKFGVDKIDSEDNKKEE